MPATVIAIYPDYHSDAHQVTVGTIGHCVEIAATDPIGVHLSPSRARSLAKEIKRAAKHAEMRAHEAKR